MKSQLVAENTGERIFVPVFDPGEEAFSTAAEFDLAAS